MVKASWRIGLKYLYGFMGYDAATDSPKKIGYHAVTHIKQVKRELSRRNKTQLKDGFSFILRIKNEALTIEQCIRDLVDIADEIIVVDNQSTDGTKEIIYSLEQEYPHIFVYEYCIEVPRVGQEHIDNYKQKGIQRFNTLKNYYNWALSKASYKKIVKWDGDFYCIKENLIEFLDFFRSRMDDNNAGFFSGITLFEHDGKTYLKKKNLYNEYRLFSKNHGFQWADEITDLGDNVCETSWHIVNAIDKNHLFINTKPIFFEVKSTQKDEFSSRSSLLKDGRDSVDKKILDNLSARIDDNKVYAVDAALMEHTCFQMIHDDRVIQDRLINEFRNTPILDHMYLESHAGDMLLINTPSLDIGGIQAVYASLRSYFNSFIETKYLLSFDVKKKECIYFLDFKKRIKSIRKNISILCTTDLFKVHELKYYKKHYGINFFGIVHSDVAYYNQYFMKNAQHFEKIIVINRSTLKKYTNKKIPNVVLLPNNIEYISFAHKKNKEDTFKLLFFSRASDDKNVIMLLYAIKKLISNKINIRLDLYIGQNKTIQSYLDLLHLNTHVFMKDACLDKNKLEIYTLYDASILPSVSEGVSMNILESINAEVPILCTDIEPNREIIKGFLPMFHFKDLDTISLHYNSITNYTTYLEYLGYDFIDGNVTSPFITSHKEKTSIFDTNCNDIAYCIVALLSNFDYYKKNTRILKELLKDTYFDTNTYYKKFKHVLLEPLCT